MNITHADWNWFFAAFAQCAAALIGIIGAFIISKLLNESSRQEEFDGRAKDFFIEFDNTFNRIYYLNFEWYDKTRIKYSSDIKKAIESNEFDGLSDQEIHEKLINDIEPGLNGTPICVQELKARQKQIRIDAGSTFPVFQQFAPEGIWDDLNEEKDKINALKVESITLTHKFNRLKAENSGAKNNLNTIKNTIWILIVGFLLTVIYPLSFMPLPVDATPSVTFDMEIIYSSIFSLRGLFLFLLSIVVIGIFTYFLIVTRNLRVKYKALDEQLKPDFGELKEYSPYF